MTAKKKFDIETLADLGTETADRWRELRATRVADGVAALRAKVAYDVVRGYYLRGVVHAEAGELRMTEPKPRTVVAIAASDVQRRDKWLWQRSRVLKPHVGVTAPAAFDANVERPRLVAVERSAGLDEALAARERANGIRRELRRRGEELVAELRAEAELRGWDGRAMNSADGWKVELTRLTFDAEELRRIAPDVAAELTATRTVAPAGVIYVAGAGFTEMDEFDGA